jgi:prepilin-type N-terminal cleavage/methylation domain-containing protein
MMNKFSKLSERGFTLAEIVIAIVIFPMFVVGIANAYGVVRNSYTLAKQLNEMYAVLSACPEIDRALEYNSLTNDTDCFPNNTFRTEGGSDFTVTYSPTLTVNDTAELAAEDPLRNIPDSKVVDISVGYLTSPSSPPLQLRMLVTRNGIGQL